MTSPEPFTRKELLELAALDTLGLLDDYEAEVYTRSFHHAPSTVQDEIKRLQAEVAGDETLCSSAEPDASLRERVLEAVARAIEREASKLAPLATIGRPRPAARDAEGRLSLAASGQFWRAAAFVLSGTLLVVAYLWSVAYRQSNRIADLALSHITDAQLQQLVGPPITDFLRDPSARRILLTSVDGDADLWAVVFVKENTGEAFLVFDGLPRSEGGAYVLQVRRGDETTEGLRAFDSTGTTLGGVHIEAIVSTTAAFSTATWEIATSAGTVLLKSA
ncbi:MAG: hypothetical protein ACYS0G_10895 [Planctomycetota bacterium]|jgi:hypothetical protein